MSERLQARAIPPGKHALYKIIIVWDIYVQDFFIFFYKLINKKTNPLIEMNSMDWFFSWIGIIRL
ncbi:hypothetical protein GCM10007366_08690 [Mammaliicoccus vitulinus]|nr:hypothetical protein BU071_05240 [Mammaliicoccus vitulinus]GGH99926.1 hypothetical protein GCM10007366_08690 [Mammaliicoccus vitulinus]